MDIIFVNSIDFKYNKQKIPLGLLSLIKCLEDANYSADLIDFDYLINDKQFILQDNLYENIELMADYLIAQGPEIISFYTMCNSYPIMLKLAEEIKRKEEKICVLLGGPQAGVSAVNTLERFDFIDVIGIGEGEKIIVDLVKTLLEDHKNLKNIPGIAFRREGKVIKNPKVNLIEDLDDLPFLNYEKIDDISNQQSLLIEVGRGCPYNCSFCSTSFFWERNFRLKSNDRILKELKYYHQKYGISSFAFNHDMFTFNRKKLIELCKQIIKLDFEINWTCSSRVDMLDQELVLMMKQAGCYKIYLGIETGSPRMQKIINKNLPLDEAMETILLLNQNKITPVISFVYGFLEETQKDLMQTITFIMKLMKHGIYNIQLHKLVVLPQTEEYNKVKNQLKINDNISDISNILFWDQIKELIKKDKKIFANFYDFHTELRNKYNELDVFMRFILNLMQQFKFTVSNVLLFYENNLLKMFFNHKTLFSNLSKDIKQNISNAAYNKNLLDIFIEYFEILIFDSNIDSQIPNLKYIYRLEKDIYNFVFKKKNKKEEIKNYEVNIFKLLKDVKNNYKSNNNCMIKFQRTAEQKAKISRIN